jgi:lipopolysaccharide biosynthesis protein
MFSLFIHIYHPDAWENIFKDKLKMLKGYSPMVIVNLCMNHPGNSQLIFKIRSDFPNALVITTPNKGRDIGGKLALIDFYLKANLQSDYLVFLHDKQSHHWFAGETWRRKLFSIIEPENITAVLAEYNKDSRIGIIGTSDLIKNEYDKGTNQFKTTNNDKLKKLIANYNLKITDYRFVAGAMFWIRSSIVQGFFSKHSPLSCREILEEGNFTDLHEGTYTHSWERVFCWLGNDQGYTIKGI